MRSNLLLAGLIFVGCSSTSAGSPDTKQDTRPDTQAEGGMCVPVYTQPGCSDSVAPFCDHGYGGACGGAYCGCDGHVQLGSCNYAYARYAYRLDDLAFSQDGSNTCDPNAVDAGAGGAGGGGGQGQ
jgi:hypothetical protein